MPLDRPTTERITIDIRNLTDGDDIRGLGAIDPAIEERARYVERLETDLSNVVDDIETALANLGELNAKRIFLYWQLRLDDIRQSFNHLAYLGKQSEQTVRKDVRDYERKMKDKLMASEIKTSSLPERVEIINRPIERIGPPVPESVDKPVEERVTNSMIEETLAKIRAMKEEN